jgi:MFS transporter, DHA1 family, inner membrane transport protein
MVIETGNRDWLVGNPDRPAQFAALWVGTCGLLILGLQPILLGALLEEHRVSFDQLALAATVEMLAIGLGSIMTAFLVGGRALRLKAAVILALAALFDHLTAAAMTPAMIVLWRGLAGLAQGALVAFAVELIARSRHAGRFGGYFVSLQTIVQALLAIPLALVIVPRLGSFGGFETLAFFSLASIAAALFLPKAYGELPKAESAGGSGVFRARPLLALASILFFYMFLGSIWAFLEPLGADAGISASVIGLMVSASLAAQIIGALVATFIENRLRFRPVLASASLIGFVLAMVIAEKPSVGIFWLVAMMVGLIWLFVVPFQIRLTIDADETRQTALLVPAAQLTGAALGPAGASFFADAGTATPVAWFAAVCALLSVAAVSLSAMGYRPATARNWKTP